MQELCDIMRLGFSDDKDGGAVVLCKVRIYFGPEMDRFARSLIYRRVVLCQNVLLAVVDCVLRMGFQEASEQAGAEIPFLLCHQVVERVRIEDCIPRVRLHPQVDHT